MTDNRFQSSQFIAEVVARVAGACAAHGVEAERRNEGTIDAQALLDIANQGTERILELIDDMMVHPLLEEAIDDSGIQASPGGGDQEPGER